VTAQTIATPPGNSGSQPTIEGHLQAARARIEVEPEELDEARRRGNLITQALLSEFPGSAVYVNGSIPHQDALTPLTDLDLGVIVAGAEHTHGPGKKGCSDLQERAANAIRLALKPEFPNSAVYWQGQRRAVLVRFRKPVDPSVDDFTADVIVAINFTGGEGLYIPNYRSWDRSHPQKHTQLIDSANTVSDRTFARVVRLLKHWNRSNGKPLCSWNIKALALPVLRRPSSLLAGMLAWFDHAIDSLGEGLTEDPAKVAPKPIDINKDMTRTQVVNQLEQARDQLKAAARLEKDGWPLQAQEQLAKFFNDEEMMPFPDPINFRAEFTQRFRSSNISSNTSTKAAGVGIAAATTVAKSEPAVRSWGIDEP
jgi:hypothetical protein